MPILAEYFFENNIKDHNVVSYEFNAINTKGLLRNLIMRSC